MRFSGAYVRSVAKSDRGVELVELAMVLPFLLLICMGVIEFGRVYFTYNILSKAVRDGARYASAEEMSSTGVIPAATVTDTKSIVVYGQRSSGTAKVPGLTTSQVSVIANPDASGNSGAPISPVEQYIMVRVAYPYHPLMKMILPNTITLSPTVKMRFLGRTSFPT